MIFYLEYKIPVVRKSELLKNRTNLDFRWKQLAMSEDLKALKKYAENIKSQYRIINYNLEVIYDKRR